MAKQLPETRRTILVIDDSSINRAMLSDFIDLLGHDVAVAEDGKQGMEAILASNPDVILLDIDMPVMTGIEVLERLLADDELKHIPVIVISGRDDVEHMARAISLGATDFLGKPFNPTVLKARLLASLEKKDLRDRERQLLRTLEKSFADLRAAEQSRDVLTHMIVHDLSNPLAVITMNAEMITMLFSMQASVNLAQLKERLAHISAAGSTMQIMIQGMLDVSKLESGQMSVVTSQTAVIPLLEGMVGQYQLAARENALSLALAPDINSVECMSDPILLERIIANLFSNAFKYATTARHVLLSATLQDDVVHISVEDDGDGIPEELHDRIFDKFYQIESAETRIRAGVGLGLTFCKMAAIAMGGDIRVETAQPHGTRFVISLPAASEYRRIPANNVV